MHTQNITLKDFEMKIGNGLIITTTRGRAYSRGGPYITTTRGGLIVEVGLISLQL